MKVLIELPTWMGDAVMSSPAIRNLIDHLNAKDVTFIGPKINIEIYSSLKETTAVFALNKNLKDLSTILKLEKYNYFFSFRSSFRSSIIKWAIRSEKKFQFSKRKYIVGHQVEKYNNFINDSIGISSKPGPLDISKMKTNRPRKKKRNLGINPGASYGSAKMWLTERFAEVAQNLSDDFDIFIFGGANEIEISNEIEKIFIENNISNYKNMAGKTSINELIELIAEMDVFITGDSGPMHLAAALQIPSISLFGPTKSNETSQWKNKRSLIIKKNLLCQPCMERECPLGHRNCMTEITSKEVLLNVKKLLNL